MFNKDVTGQHKNIIPYLIIGKGEIEIRNYVKTQHAIPEKLAVHNIMRYEAIFVNNTFKPFTNK